tara:strand:- start:1372 stop:1590 length:219 start_codon:yes stop_codon:yes gene_type:complete
MKKVLLSLVLLTMLNACSVPIVGSLAGNGLTAAATGQVEKSIASVAVDVITFKETGKTPAQLFFSEKPDPVF